MSNGEVAAAIWRQADVVVLAIGIYMERHRIGWWSARDTLYDDAARRGVDIDTLADQIVQRLDGRHR